LTKSDQQQNTLGRSLLPGAELFRPSEYTAMLIQQIREYGSRISGKNTLEIGCGSGVVLAALAKEGATQVCGVDIEQEAIRISAQTLSDAGYLEIAELHHGDMWSMVQGRVFDVIVANLPQAPTEIRTVEGRHLTWNFGGPSGRAVLDQFLHGVSAHLAINGWGLITHFDPLDVAKTVEILNASGLKAKVVMTRLLTYSEERLNDLVPQVVADKIGESIIFYGKHVFSEVHIVEFRRVGSPDE
jgi:methylase of polypeptide subunit release factors